ncbi:unnamed protein product, partial [Trichogramma brassicae]
RCTCAKRLGPVSLSPSPSDETPEDSRRPSLRASRSLSPEDLPQQQQLLQKRPSATDSRSLTPVPQSEQQARTPSPQPQPEAQKANSKASKKDKARMVEERKAMRSKWAVKPHFSLPSEPKGHKLWSDKDPKSKSLKERPKYSVRRSLSPDPDPRQVYRLDNRLVRKLISPEVSLVDAKWAPYEGHSPLPNVGMRRRDTKKVVHEIQWQPYESPIHIGKSANAAAPATESSEGPLAYSTLEKQVSIYGAEDPPKPGDEFSSVTPTHLPPPIATPQHGVSSGTDDDDEAFRMRMLNQVSAFPMYQGAWRGDAAAESTRPGSVDARLGSQSADSTAGAQAAVRAGGDALAAAREAIDLQASLDQQQRRRRPCEPSRRRARDKTSDAPPSNTRLVAVILDSTTRTSISSSNSNSSSRINVADHNFCARKLCCSRHRPWRRASDRSARRSGPRGAPSPASSGASTSGPRARTRRATILGSAATRTTTNTTRESTSRPSYANITSELLQISLNRTRMHQSEKSNDH